MVRVCNFFQPLPATHVWMHHFADNWTSADDGYLDYYVVKTSRGVMRARSHLGTAFHLEHTHRIRIAQCLIYERIFGQCSQVDMIAVVPWNELKRVLKNGHHP